MHLVDTTMFFAPQSGGVKRYLLAKQQWLVAQYPSIRHTLLIPGPRDTPVHEGTATVAALPLPFSHGYRFPLRSGPWRRRLVEMKPSLIEAGDPYRLAWAVLDAAQTLGIPALAFYHSDISRMLSSRLGAWTRGPMERYLRSLYQQFDVVVAPSRLMASKIEALGVSEVVLQPLGVDTALFHPARRDPLLRQELGIPVSSHILVFAGRFAHEKNIPVLMETARRLGPEFHLLLIGATRAGRPEPNVTMLPYQPQGLALARYIASADAMIHAGENETFGLIVAEAMACGLPVVGIDAGAVPEVVDPDTGVLVPRASSDLLAQGVRALFEQDVNHMGQMARARVERQYSWNQVLGSLLALYARLTGLSEGAIREHQRAFQ